MVEVPQSHTAHMARDHRYHKRFNFTTAMMEDYEVRDVMNRRTHPKIRGSIYVNRQCDRLKPGGVVLVRIENVGSVLARHVMVEIELPIEMNGWIGVDPPFWVKRTEDGQCHHFRLTLEQGEGPIFPGSDVILKRKLSMGVKIRDEQGNVPRSTRHVGVSIFADEMPPIRAKLESAPVILGWTPVTEPAQGLNAT